MSCRIHFNRTIIRASLTVKVSMILSFCITYIFVKILITPNFVAAGSSQDWTMYSSDGDCLLMTTEKKKGNLEYPSTLFLSYDKSKNSLGAAVQNFEWLLTDRKSQVSFVTNQGSALKFNVNLSNNLMSIAEKSFITAIETDFKRDTIVRLNNSKGNKVSEFSLMGFTKSYEAFKECVILNKPKSQKYSTEDNRTSKKYELNASTKETLGFFLKAAVLFAIANGDLPPPRMGGSNFDITVPDLISPNNSYSSNRTTDYSRNITSDAPNIIGGKSGTTYRSIGNTLRSSDGESWRRIGNTVRSSNGTSYRQIGNTIRSSDGESWRRIGDTIRSSSGVTWRRMGNTIRSSDGVTCRQIGITTRCN